MGKFEKKNRIRYSDNKKNKKEYIKKEVNRHIFLLILAFLSY